MKKVLSLAAAFGLSLSFAAAAQAGGACCQAKSAAQPAAAAGAACCKDKAGATAAGATCADKGAAAASASCADKAGAVAAKCCATKGGPTCVEGMPKMGYRVGDKVVSCPDEARKLMAEHKDAKLAFVVGDKDYTDQAEATKAYGVVLDSYLNNMLTVREVAAAGNKPAHFELAGYSYGTREQADKAAAAAKMAAEKVTMNYRVAGKSYNCPDEAKKAATGEQQVEYVVGESTSTCNVMAGIDLTKARIAAANKALEGGSMASRS